MRSAPLNPAYTEPEFDFYISDLDAKALIAENYIKGFKNALAGDRLSCHRFAANSFRLLLYALAYWLALALPALSAN